MANPITVQCPECQAKLKLKSRKSVGRKVGCPKCQHKFVLSLPPEEDLDSNWDAGIESSADSGEKLPSNAAASGGKSGQAQAVGKDSKNKTTLMLISGLGVLVLVMLGLSQLGGGGSEGPSVATSRPVSDARSPVDQPDHRPNESSVEAEPEGDHPSIAEAETAESEAAATSEQSPGKVEVPIVDSRQTEAIAELRKRRATVREDDHGQAIAVYAVGSVFGDDEVELLKTFSELTHLSLAVSKVGDESLEHLASLYQLEDLNLSNTNVTDAGIKHLGLLNRLRKLDLSATQVTPKGIRQLQEALPECDITYLFRDASDRWN